MIYVASPYSDPETKARKQREPLVMVFTACLVENDVYAYSPIVHNVRLVPFMRDKEQGFTYWREFDLHMISLSEAVYVLALPGYKESVGVQAEIAFAREHDIPVQFWDFDIGGPYVKFKRLEDAS